MPDNFNQPHHSQIFGLDDRADALGPQMLPRAAEKLALRPAPSKFRD
jgi:hypothetical protein